MILRVMHLRDGYRMWWIGCDGRGGRVVSGPINGMKQGVVDSWREHYGEPERVVTVPGLHSPAEAAAAMAGFATGAGRASRGEVASG